MFPIFLFSGKVASRGYFFKTRPSLRVRPITGFSELQAIVGSALTSGGKPLREFNNPSEFPAQPVGRCVEEIEALPLKDTSKRKWLHDNAARFLGLK